MLEHNANCKLPCWWGITPGGISWEQAWQLLSPTAESIEEVPPDEKITYLGTRSSDIHLFAFEYETLRGYSDFVGIGVENGRVIYIEMGDNIQATHNNTPRYQLAYVLETYGVPTDVLVYVLDGPTGPEIWIGLEYKEGIIAAYSYKAVRLTAKALSQNNLIISFE